MEKCRTCAESGTLCRALAAVLASRTWNGKNALTRLEGNNNRGQLAIRGSWRPMPTCVMLYSVPRTVACLGTKFRYDGVQSGSAKNALAPSEKPCRKKWWPGCACLTGNTGARSSFVRPLAVCTCLPPRPWHFQPEASTLTSVLS